MIASNYVSTHSGNTKKKCSTMDTQYRLEYMALRRDELVSCLYHEFVAILASILKLK